MCAESTGDVDSADTGAGGIGVQLLSVCLAAPMALFRLPEFCREVKPPPLRGMLACTCSRLLDDRLAATRGPYAATAAQVIKALKMISITSAIQAPRSASLSALLFLLCHPVIPSPQSSPKFRTKITTIFAKLLNRILAEEIENATGSPFGAADLPVIIFALNDFFSVFPRKDRGCEVQYDAAVGLLMRLILHIGSDSIVGIISDTLPGGTCRPLLATLQKEMPSDGVRRSFDAGGGGGGGMSPELADLIAKMTSSMPKNPDAAVEMLAAFRLAHPSVDIASHLNSVNGAHKGFILSQPAKIEMDGQSKAGRLAQLKAKLRNSSDGTF